MARIMTLMKSLLEMRERMNDPIPLPFDTDMNELGITPVISNPTSLSSLLTPIISSTHTNSVSTPSQGRYLAPNSHHYSPASIQVNEKTLAATIWPHSTPSHLQFPGVPSSSQSLLRQPYRYGGKKGGRKRSYGISENNLYTLSTCLFNVIRFVM
jgi:hypothetical protein